jgi:PAS domain S-box-containing protein
MTYPAGQVPREATASDADLRVKVPEPWRDSVSRGTLTVCAVVAPLLAALGLFVGSTEREAVDIGVLVSAGVLLPILRLGWRVPVQRRATAAILMMVAAALYLTARAGFAAGASGVVVSACVLGVIVLGRRLGLALIAVSALAHVIIGILVVKRVFVLDPREVDPLLYRTWLRMAASTSLLSVLLALVVDFVIRHVETSARTTAAALKDLRAAHEALRESEERYRSLVDHSLDGVLLSTPSGDILEANPAACRILQRTPEEIRALGRAAVVDVDDPRLAPLLEERRLTGRTRGELDLLRKDGTLIPVEVGSAVFRDRNGELRTSTSIRDLTDRRRSEKEQRILADLGAVLSPLRYESSLKDVAPLVARDLADLVVFFVVQPDGDLHRVAAAHRDPARAWIGDAVMTSLRTTVRPNHPARRVLREGNAIIRQFAPELLEQSAENPEHLRILRAMGLRSAMVVPLSIGDTRLGVLGLASSSRPFEEADVPLTLEIGRRCALFIESARLHRSEEAAILAKDEVLAIVAHDLRNPLANMMFQLALLRRPPGEPERRSMETVDALDQAARRMRSILADLLDVTNFESGQLELNRTRVAPAEVITEVSRSQRELIYARSLELRIDVAPNLPDIWAERSRVLQVLENLIGNATKFTTAGTVSLGAKVEAGEVVFWVADTGVGIAAEDVAHLFDRFWQARRSHRSGAGLGLAIVQEIVYAHKGRLWVDSTPGSGSTFFFTMPSVPIAPTSA